tara:strand:- start:2696 stop:3631 length:936 start_codon:yes stop_codon:yes gene_type:complete
MINKKIISLIVFIFLFLHINLYAENNVFIAYKVENEIITNVDVENEAKYLIALNNQLKNLTNKKLLMIARESIIKETIKKIELLKYYPLDQKDPFLDTVIKDFYQKLNLKNKSEFENYLSNYNLTINEIKKKIEIETTWNQLIFDKYKRQINIDEKSLKNRISLKKKSQKKEYYLLSEIVFEIKKDQSLEDRIKEINNSIKEIGFKNTANIFSVSNSAKFGGNIGWVDEKNLSEKISTVVKKLKISENSETIQLGNNYLLLRLEDKKNESIKIDEKKELKKMILYEQNRKLEKFSKIYFNKVKINTNISEL